MNKNTKTIKDIILLFSKISILRDFMTLFCISTLVFLFLKGLTRREACSHSVSRGVDEPHTELSSPCSGGIGGFPVFGGGYPSALSHLDEGGFEPDDGAAEVTCM